jgi:hypothetical protein
MAMGDDALDEGDIDGAANLHRLAQELKAGELPFDE